MTFVAIYQQCSHMWCFSESSKTWRAAEHLPKGREFKMENTVPKWRIYVSTWMVYEGRETYCGKQIFIFPPLPLPRYELNVTLFKATPASFHLALLWTLATNQELSRAKLISHNRPYVKTGSSFPTCDLNRDQTDFFSFVFCSELSIWFCETSC